MFLFLQIVVIWTAYLLNSAKLVWAVAIFYLICQKISPLKPIKDSLFSDKSSQQFQGPLTSIFIAIINLRCVSFCLDRIWNKVEKETVSSSILMLIAYCFYLPLLVLGPQVSSETFKDSLQKPRQLMDKSFALYCLTQILRYGVWFTVTDASLYFMYQHAFRFHPDTINTLRLTALCGMGYFMLLYFQTKYTVMYGFSGFLAHLDNVSAPPHPKCFARMHLYSDVWRYFDNGLYLFMKQYIYLPVQNWLPTNQLSRLFASATCFIFVYIWHDISQVILIWSSLSFLCLTSEGLAKYAIKSASYKQWETCNLSGKAVRRLHALFASHLLLFGHLSFFYLVFGLEVGHIFMRRILLESWPCGVPTIIFFLYCCSQTSIEMKNYEIKKQIRTSRRK